MFPITQPGNSDSLDHFSYMGERFFTPLAISNSFPLNAPLPEVLSGSSDFYPTDESGNLYPELNALLFVGTLGLAAISLQVFGSRFSNAVSDGSVGNAIRSCLNALAETDPLGDDNRRWS